MFKLIKFQTDLCFLMQNNVMNPNISEFKNKNLEKAYSASGTNKPILLDKPKIGLKMAVCKIRSKVKSNV